MKDNKKVINFLPLLLILPVVLLVIFNLNFNKDFVNIVDKIFVSAENEVDENEKYTYEEVKVLAVSLRVKENYDDNVKIIPLTCKVNVNRMVKLIYMDGEEELGFKYINYRKPAGDLMVPTKKGFDFVEWTNKDEEVVDKDTVIASDVDYYVYANWKKHVSTLTVNPAEGTWNNSKDTKKFSMEYEETKEIPDPVREGYNFKGWELKGEASTIDESKVFTMGYEDSSLTAKWEPKEYVLHYDVNQGNPLANPTKKIQYTKPYGELATTTRSYYTFGGWYTTATNGTKVSEQTVLSTPKDVTIYAHWNNTAPSEPQFTITYQNSKNSESGMLTNNREVITVIVKSHDKEEGTPHFNLECVSGGLCKSGNYEISGPTTANDQAIFTITAKKMGVGLLRATAFDTPGLSSKSNEIVYVYGPDGSISKDEKYTQTTFDSQWLEELEGCFISEYSFSVQFASSHSNGSTSDPDKMVVKGRTKSGQVKELFEWHGNMEGNLHITTVVDMSQYQDDPIVSFDFYTYSPHTGCTPAANIHYSVKYKFNKAWIT